MLDTGRARTVSHWEPRIDAVTALVEGVAGIPDAVGTSSPVLRRRTPLGQLTELLRSGPITRRRLS